MAKQDRAKGKQNLVTQARQIRQSNAMHRKTRWQSNANQGKATQSKAQQGKARQAKEGKTNKVNHKGKARQGKARQDKAKQIISNLK